MARLIFSIFCMLACMPLVGYSAGTAIYQLPFSSKEYQIVVYTLGHAAQSLLEGLPVIDKEKNVRNAVAFLKSQKINIPKDGFALYFESNKVLVVAAPSEVQDVLAFMLD